MRAAFCLLLGVVSFAGLNAGMPLPANSRETVVLLHGLAMGRWAMRPLARALEKEGYRVINLGYPSRTMPIEEIAARYLPEQLRTHGVADSARLHFVTHSMGSMVVRLYLREQRPANLGRVVMLGPPNHGSVAADRAAQSRWLRWVLGVNTARLGTGEQAVTRKLPAADYDVGIIAGRAHVNPVSSGWLAAPHDGAVTVESTRLEGMRDFVVMNRSHTVMLWRSDVIAQVKAFLRDGKFSAPKPSSPAV